MPAVCHVGQVDEEVRRQCPFTIRQHTKLGTAIVGTQNAQPADENRHFLRRQPQKLRPVEHHFLG